LLPDLLFPDGRAPSDVDDQARHQVAQIEAPIEMVGQSGKVAGGVLALLQRVVGAGKRGLEVAKHGVHTQDVRQIPKLQSTNSNENLRTVVASEQARKHPA
jgi:hypothetical protein